MKILIPIMDGYIRFARRHPVPFICINLILLVLWISVIMGFSGEDAQVSGSRSAKVLVGIVRAIDPSTNVTLNNYESIEFLDNCEKVIRKIAHMFEYGVLAALVWSTLFGFAKLPERLSYILPVLFVCLIGSIDEKNQTHVEGRYGSWIDVCVDMAGAVIVVCVIYRLMCRYLALKREMNNSPDA